MITFNVTTQAVVDGVDHRCRELDRKWGIGRLRLLVDDELRARFDLQRQLFNASLVNGDEEQVALHGAAMRRGLDALDAAAAAAGAFPLSPKIWECTLPCGEVVSIVRTEAEAIHVARECEVYTLTEIGALIERLGDQIRKVKTMYPGATVAEIRDREPSPPFMSEQDRSAYVEELATRFQPDEEIPF
jgi:hypothetical protein